MIVCIPVRLKLNITFVVIDKTSYIINNKFFDYVSGITVIDLQGIGDPPHQKRIIMIQVPVEGYLLYRGIKGTWALVDSGRCIVPYKATKPRDNNTIMSE